MPMFSWQNLVDVRVEAEKKTWIISRSFPYFKKSTRYPVFFKLLLIFAYASTLDNLKICFPVPQSTNLFFNAITYNIPVIFLFIKERFISSKLKQKHERQVEVN